MTTVQEALEVIKKSGKTVEELLNMDSQQSECITYSSGTKQWYRNSELHREDGPAVECSSGTKYWFLNGKHIITIYTDGSFYSGE